MLFRKQEELQILSHKNICALNYIDREKFLNIYFDELRTYLLPIDSFATFHHSLAKFPVLLQQFKNFWGALAHCAANTESMDNKKIYLNAEQNIFLLYYALLNFRKKYYLQKIENLFHSLHLVMVECYAKNVILAFKLPTSRIRKNEEELTILKKMLANPAQAVLNFETKFCKKEFSSLFFLYQQTDAIRKDISRIAHKYPYADHAEILYVFDKKLGNCP